MKQKETPNPKKEASPEQQKQTALIIGFDEDPNFKFNPAKNPFMKRPPLRS